MARTKIAALTAMLIAGGCAERTQTQVDAELLEISQSLNAWESSETSPPARDPDSTQPPVHAMIGGLEKKLAANPDDVKGWSLLAQSYAFTGRMQEAQDAADKAVALGADAAEMKARILRAHGDMAN